LIRLDPFSSEYEFITDEVTPSALRHELDGLFHEGSVVLASRCADPITDTCVGPAQPLP